MNFETGKLYKCSDYYLLVYPSAEKASTMASWANAYATPGWAEHYVNYWSKELNCQVRCLDPGDPMLFIEETKIDGRTYFRFLFPEFEGWINWNNWLNFKEIKP